MQTTTKNAKFLDRDVIKGCETVPADSTMGPIIEDHELDGWNFTDTETKGGFTHLYFVKLEE